MPKVSCLMLTSNRKDAFLRSLECFQRQTYCDRELVIVSNGNETYREMLQASISSDMRRYIHQVFVPAATSLGTLRNRCLDECSGEIICQWDDDDLSHPNRIAFQVAALEGSNADACILGEHLHWFTASNQLFWCDWSRASRDIGLAGTVVAYHRSLPRYATFRTSDEDSGVLEQLLLKGGRIAVMLNAGYLYIYTFHGKNTFSRRHHTALVRVLGIDTESIMARYDMLSTALMHYRMPAPLKVSNHRGETAATWYGSADEDKAVVRFACSYETLVCILKRGRQNSPQVANNPFGNLMLERYEDLGLVVDECGRLNLRST